MTTKILEGCSQHDLELAGQIIRQGGLVAFPTETVYGLGASALSADSAEKVYKAKGRPSDNPLIVHLSKAEEAEKYAYTNKLYYKLADSFMPGPLTVILPKKDIIPDEVTGSLKTVGIRVPSNVTARKFIELSGCPIAAPSANLSGKPSTTKTSHVIADLMDKIDAIIASEDSEIGLESTIVMPYEGGVKMLRPGAVTPEMIENIGISVTLDKAITEKLGDNEKPLAPGMKYRHYAPRAEVTLYSGSRENVNNQLKCHKGIDSAVILCYNEDKELVLAKNSYVIGSRENESNTAHRLFAILRELDEREGVKNIYAELPSSKGMGLAIFNRLIKASGYNVKEI